MHSNQHFMVDIDDERVLAEDLAPNDLDKLVKAIKNHRPDIRTKMSRYFLNSQEILPRGILRKYFDEYDAEEETTAPASLTKIANDTLPPQYPPTTTTPLKVKIMNKPLDFRETGWKDGRKDFLVFLVGEGGGI